ncbi:hypothetical protein IJU97_01560 [bacterium]|nr:hypothetical protein [bacterium]
MNLISFNSPQQEASVAARAVVASIFAKIFLFFQLVSFFSEELFIVAFIV